MQQVCEVMQVGFQVATTLDFLFRGLVFVRLDECGCEFLVFDGGVLACLHEFHGFFRVFADPGVSLFKSAEKSLDLFRFLFQKDARNIVEAAIATCKNRVGCQIHQHIGAAVNSGKASQRVPK